MVDGCVEFLLPAEYHGNPIADEGSLVVFEWGYDIAAYLQHHSRLSVILLQQENMNLGIAGQLTNVIVALKQPSLPE